MGSKAISTPRKAREEMSQERLVEVERRADVPQFASDAEAAAYWDTHGPSERFLDEAILGPGKEPSWLLPARGHAKPVAVRFDEDVVARLKALAKKKHTGYQTLLKQFVAERLYEEEKREGIIPS